MWANDCADKQKEGRQGDPPPHAVEDRRGRDREVKLVWYDRKGNKGRKDA